LVIPGADISNAYLHPTCGVDSIMPVKHFPVPDFQIPECEGDILQIQELDFSYPDGHEALRGVSLSICEGEKVALVGPNGAGKSTLMLHINGILGKNSPVSVAGLSISPENLPLIRALVGLVFQNPDDQLFSPTVFEDVAFGPLHMGLSEDEVYRRVREALAVVKMEEFKDRLSHHLSMGEKKRIAIATVLAMRPQILVFDEPSAGLDPRARRSLIEFLRNLPLTMLISTHDIRMVQEIFPRMIIMDEGKIVADGLTAELLQNRDLLEAHGLESPDNPAGN
jgi:cobalt/nickel transport system ATP-binding protein